MEHIVLWLRNVVFFLLMIVLSSTNIKAANLCNTGTEIFIGAYHSSIVSTKDDFYAFGEAIAANGTSNNLTPVSILPANGYNYTGDLLYATDSTHDTQAFILTTDGLYVWGASGGNTAASHETAIVTGVAFHSIDMPVGVLPADVTYLTATNGGVFLVAGGKVYAQGITSDLMGDNGASADANGWHIVQKSSGGDLTNVELFKANYNGAFAVTFNDEYYTWGSAVFLGNGTGSQTLTSATLMTIPFVGSASLIAVTGYDNTPGLSYYVLNPVNTKVYVLGGNSDGQLGIGSNGNTSTSWTTVKKSAGVDLVGVIDINADDNSDHYPTAGAIVNGYDDGSGPANDVFLVWGRNSSNALGAGSADIVYPYVPTGFIIGTSRATKIEMGGHTTMYYDPDYTDTFGRTGKMCYIGHKINGSMGDGVSSSSTVSTFECNDTPWLPTLCAAERPPVATDDDKENQPVGSTVTLNVVADDNGHGIDSDPDGTVDISTVDLTPLTETIDQTLVVSGEGNWSVDAAGLVTFIPDPALVGDPTDIEYTVQDDNDNESNTATIHITYVKEISIADVSQNELNSGSSNFDFVITLSAPSATAVTVAYTTTAGTGVAGDDYTATSGTATIAAGSTTTTVSVPVSGDTTVEGDDTFTVNLSSPVGATITDGSGLGTIMNDDSVNVVSISDSNVTEGLVESHTIIMSAISLTDETYTFSLTDNTTNGLTDYITSPTFTNGVTLLGTVLTVPASVTTFTMTVPTVDDAVHENEEFYDVTIGGVSAKGIITDDNDVPVAEDDSQSTSINTPVAVPVLNNDHDPEGDKLIITDVNTTGTNGTVTFDANGTVIFTPETDFIGTTIFSYTISDGNGGEDTATVTITVTDPSDPGSNTVTAVADSANIEMDTNIDIPVLINDYDPEGDTFSLTNIVTSPANGTAIIDDNGTPDDPSDDYITYEPNTDFIGNDTFEYEITDENGNRDIAIVTVNVVDPTADAVPNAVADAAITDKDVPVSIDVLDNDTHPDNDDLNITSFTQPANGVVTLDDGGTPNDPSDDQLVYTPNPGFEGHDTFMYTVTDSNGDTASAAVTVTLKRLILTLNAFCENDVPYISYDIALQGIDPAGETATLTWTGLDGETEVETGLALSNTHHLWTGAEVDGSGNGTVWPGWNELSDGSWEEVYSDWRRWNADQSDATVTVTLSVNPTSSVTLQYPPATSVCSANPPLNVSAQGLPIATDNLDVPITSYNPTVINVLSNGDSFGVNGPGTVEIIFTQPTHGTVELDDGGTPNDPTDDVLLYSPQADVNNITDSFTYTITDALGNTSTATVTLDVNCASTQRSDGGDALGTFSIMMMMFLTLMSGLYFIRKEEQRGNI